MVVIVIFLVEYKSSPWLTVVVRAPDEDEAFRLAAETGLTYGIGGDGRFDSPGDFTLELLDPDGPAGVLVEDPS